MHITSVNQHTTSNFDVHVSFELSDDVSGSAETYYENVIAEMSEWASKSFTDSFVLIEYASKIIAGGAIDNVLAWEEKWYEDNGYSSTLKYQIRGSTHDITLFLLKYKSEKKL